MKVRPGSLPGVLVLQPDVIEDERGFFLEAYHREAFRGAGIDATFVQDNHSGSQQGVLRGLHYQIRQPQGKLVRVVRGEVFDAVVDLRRKSPTYGKWSGEKLSEDDRAMLWIPPGFAHGFYTLSDWAEVIYKVTEPYAPEWDRTLIWNDPDVGVEWPLIAGKPPLLSPKDAAGMSLRDADGFNDI